MSQAGLIDGLQFARAGQERRGLLDLERLPRLAQVSCSTQGLKYHLSGGIAGDGRPCLRVRVDGEVRLACQRCLAPVPVPIAVDVELRLAESLREIAEADDEVDRVLASGEMDVGELVEDEVLLALPMVPRHESCGIALPGGDAKILPFSVLAELKRGRSGK